MTPSTKRKAIFQIRGAGGDSLFGWTFGGHTELSSQTFANICLCVCLFYFKREAMGNHFFSLPSDYL